MSLCLRMPARSGALAASCRWTSSLECGAAGTSIGTTTTMKVRTFSLRLTSLTSPASRLYRRIPDLTGREIARSASSRHPPIPALAQSGLAPRRRQRRGMVAIGDATSVEATLLVDSRCELGECVLWDERRAALFWTDITGQRLWMHRPASGKTRRWSLPQPLGCFGLSRARTAAGLAKYCSFSISIRCSTRGRHRAPLRSSGVDPSIDTRITAGLLRNATSSSAPRTKGPARRAGASTILLPTPSRPRTAPVAIPNSICFSLGGDTLYFCDSVAGRILCCSYDAGRASVSHMREFARVPAGAMADGSVVDADGGLWNAQWGAGRVARYGRDGQIDRVVAVPAKNPSCCAFGGAGIDVLYVSTAREGRDAPNWRPRRHAGGLFAAPIPGVARIARKPRGQPAMIAATGVARGCSTYRARRDGTIVDRRLRTTAR